MEHGQALPQQSLPSDTCCKRSTESERTVALQRVFQSGFCSFHGTFEHAAIGMALVDMDGRFLRINPSFCRIVGYSKEELQSKNYQSITHPDDMDARPARAVVDGEIDHFHREKRYIHKQGHDVWVMLSVSVVRDPSRRPCYKITQVQDITARKSAERASARRLRRLERLTDAVSRILHALANVPDDTMYAKVLQIVLDSFESKTGVFLRIAGDRLLIGAYGSATKQADVRFTEATWSKLWDVALNKHTVVMENSEREMDCGRIVRRSLVAPLVHDGVPLGLFHMADAETDYDSDDLDLALRISGIIAPVVAARMKRDELSPREAQVMDLIASGKTVKQIASALNISVQTTAKHRARVLDKVGVNNDVELVRVAIRMQNPPVESLQSVGAV